MPLEHPTIPQRHSEGVLEGIELGMAGLVHSLTSWRAPLQGSQDLANIGIGGIANVQDHLELAAFASVIVDVMLLRWPLIHHKSTDTGRMTFRAGI